MGVRRIRTSWIEVHVQAYARIDHTYAKIRLAWESSQSRVHKPMNAFQARLASLGQ